MPDEEELQLNPELIKVLASDTRLDLLRLLRQRRMTLTELATQLDLKKATILEHLEKLTAAGFVRRMDDPERLWVYYELTRRGKAVVNPGKARIYLLVGTGFLAVVVGLALMLALQPPAPGLEPTFRVGLQEEALPAGAPALLHASVEGPPGTPDAWLLDAQAAEVVRQGGPAVGVRVAVQREGDLATLRVPQGLAPGTYAVLLRLPSGEDNRAAMPLLRVEAINATPSQAAWRQGLDGPLSFQVVRGSAPLDGMLQLVHAEGTVLEALVRNGAARAGEALLDAAPWGAYSLRFVPQDGGAAIPVPGRVDLLRVGLAATPRHLLAGQPTLVSVQLAAPGAPTTPAESAAFANATAAHQGSGVFLLTAPRAGSVEVRLGRLAPLALTAHLDLPLRIEALADGHELSLGPGGAGAALYLDEAPLGLANASGRLRTASLPAGDHVLGIQLPGGAALPRALRVEGANVSEPPRTLRLEATAAAQGQLARVEATLANPSPAPEPATLVVRANGALVAAASLQVPGEDRVNASLPAPLAGNGTQQLTLQAEGLARAPLIFVPRAAPPPPTSPPPPSPPPTTPPGMPPPGSPPSPPATTPPTTPPSTPPGTPPGPGGSLSQASSAVLQLPVVVLAEQGPASPGFLRPSDRVPGDLRPDTMPTRVPGFEGLLALGALALALAVRRRRA